MNNASGKFPNVLGYMTEAERLALQRCVIESSGVSGDALEIGSLNGLSALLILSVLQSDKKLYCVEIGDTSNLNSNVAGSPFAGQLRVINSDVKDLKPEEIPTLSFAFVDHDHSYENTVAAFNLIWPKLSAGGIIAFHDYGHPNYEGGTSAINMLAIRHSLREYLRETSLIVFVK